MGMTEKGTLRYGVEVDGVRHKDFELRLPTMADVEDALEAAGPGACQARVNRMTWARTITKLGDLPEDKRKPAALAELLAGMDADEYGPLSAAEDSLRKKLAAASASSETSAS
jgi:hypothetical protein